MTQTSTFLQIAKDWEPIPGYVLTDRIGAGGYGEVWKATAPGGLTKAIKFVYGHMDEKRASRELKSLNRVKDLKHPFLLTLERIEVVDDHLLIVTELADFSLRERFEECRESGLPGVPRDELMTYIREAADVLDYLLEGHELQHLDVKPENILLVGRHAKLADFGLLKDLHEISASLINGLTPKYASPELFEGRPSRHSDQYSLAIVYQEMLTGRLPFDGTTAAKLASQHLHCSPDLSELTPLERFAVGKALSKNPHRRFRSCHEFVERLLHRSRATITSGSDEAATTEGDKRRPDVKTVIRHGITDPPSTNKLRAGNVHDGQTIEVAAPEIDSLPPLKLDGKQADYRPTLFIGIGGTGGKVLCRLRQLLKDRIGDVACTPALQFLYLDTDIASINEATSHGGDGSLDENEAVAVPLRHTWDYRAKDFSGLQSISRRWIYNAPRSLRTEGLRALGRIALLDHSQRILDRLRCAILSATDAEAVVATAKHTGLDFREKDPRVFIVASVAGGTGGGMVIDCTYAVRQLLAEAGLSDEKVCGILTYSTPRGDNSRSLAPANALACLEELQYFSLPGHSYPGEPACGLLSFREDLATFPHSYLADLGDDLAEDEFSEAVDRLAAYLLLNCVSSASTFFDALREIEHDDSQNSSLRLRTMGLCPLDADSRKLKSEWIEILCGSVIRNWRGGVEAATEQDHIGPSDYERLLDRCESSMNGDNQHQTLATRRALELGLNPEHIIENVRAALGEELNCDPDAYLQKIARDYLDKASADGNKACSALWLTIRRLNAVFGLEHGEPLELNVQLETLREVLFPRARELGREIGEALQKSIIELVDTPEGRVTGARRFAEQISTHLKSVQTATCEQSQSAKNAYATFHQNLEELCDQSKQDSRVTRDSLVEALYRYVHVLQDGLVLEGACEMIRSVEPSITACSSELRDLWKDLNQLSEEFRVPEHCGSTTPQMEEDSEGFIVSMAEVFAQHHWQMVVELDCDIEADFFSAERRLRHVLTQANQHRADFIARLRAVARKVILRFAKKAAFSKLERMLEEENSADLRRPLERCLKSASPRLLMAGGAKRLLLVTAENVYASSLSEEIEQVSGDAATRVYDPAGNILVCYDAERVPPHGVAARFIRSRPDCQELASRLHTRIDISW